jgi:two-component system response regulator DegU
MINVMLVSGSTFSCLGISKVLSVDRNFKVVKQTSDSKDIIDWTSKLAPDLLLLCSRLLIEKGDDFVPKLKDLTNECKVVIFDSSFTARQELRFVKEGVVGIINSECDPNDFVKALHKVHAGEYWLRRGLFQSLMLDNHLIPNSTDQLLTRRETEILSMIVNGLNNLDISTTLFISNSTVKSHINNMYRKLKVKDRMQAVLCAKKMGL